MHNQLHQFVPAAPDARSPRRCAKRLGLQYNQFIGPLYWDFEC